MLRCRLSMTWETEVSDQDNPRWTRHSVCYFMSSHEDGSRELGQVRGSGNPLTVTLGPNNPDLETGVAYYVMQEVIPGWSVVGNNPVSTMIRPFGTVGVAFINTSEVINRGTGALLINKVDEGDDPLAGARWIVESLDADRELEANSNLCDADDGGTTTVMLPPGDYAGVESVPPAGYCVNHGQRVVTIVANRDT